MVQELARTEDLGAGNVFRVAARDASIAGGTVIELDQPYRSPDGRVHNELTLAELDELADRIAGGHWRDGVRAKDPVAILVAEGVRYVLHYAALTRIGAIPVFLNSRLDGAVAARLITGLGAVAVVTEPDRLPESDLAIPCRHADPFADEPFRLHHHVDGDPVLIAHTSGTTAMPKLVQHNHAGFFYGIRQQLGAAFGTRVLSALPHSHASSVTMLMACAARGARVRLATDRRPEAVAGAIQEFRPDLVAGFSSVFVRLALLDPEAWDLGSVGYWLSTGDANHEAHIRKLTRHGRHRRRDGEWAPGSLFIDNFGSTEFGFAMFRQVHAPDSDRFGRCIGRPFEWVDVQIFDDEDRPVRPSEVGRLAVRAPAVTAGYWNDSLRTERNRVAGYWLTGDLAYRAENGLYYHVDRVPDVIATDRGPMYSCFVEELILERLPEVFDCSLVGVRSDSGEPESPLLEVEPSTPGCDLEDLLRRVNELMAERALPPIGRLRPKQGDGHVGITGKVLKRAMRDAYAADAPGR